jgi:hypothetical protein
MEIENSNEYIESFLLEIDKTIDTGNIIYIKQAIIKYTNIIDKSYITWANSLIFEIIQEKLENIQL